MFYAMPKTLFCVQLESATAAVCMFLRYLVHTTHDISFVPSYPGQGSWPVPQFPSTWYNRAPLLLAALPTIASGFLSTQINVVRRLFSFIVISHPLYSTVHVSGQVYLPGIMICLERLVTSHTAHGALCWFKPESACPLSI